MFGPLMANLTLRVNSTDRVSNEQFLRVPYHTEFLAVFSNNNASLSVFLWRVKHITSLSRKVKLNFIAQGPETYISNFLEIYSYLDY